MSHVNEAIYVVQMIVLVIIQVNILFGCLFRKFLFSTIYTNGGDKIIQVAVI